jgi:hypothetical protein
MLNPTIDDYIELYYRKSGGVRGDIKGTYREANEKGFCTYDIYKEEDHIFVHNVCGDGKYWDAFLQKLAKEHGLSKIMFFTQRDPEAWKKSLGYEIQGYVMEKKI